MYDADYPVDLRRVRRRGRRCWGFKKLLKRSTISQKVKIVFIKITKIKMKDDIEDWNTEDDESWDDDISKMTHVKY